MSKNAINWFEIPVSDLKRATAFYEDLVQDLSLSGTPILSETGIFRVRRSAAGNFLAIGSL